MTNEKINIAIAKACGWEYKTRPVMGYGGITSEIQYYWSKNGSTGDLPDYCNVLNVMHEAEKVLTYEQAEQFEGELCDICDMENRHKEYPLPFRFAVAHASAAQRAEAFLKTIEKWNSDKI
jgi:hypothetical protein